MPTHVIDQSRRTPTIPAPPIVFAILVALALFVSLVISTSSSPAAEPANPFVVEGP